LFALTPSLSLILFFSPRAQMASKIIKAKGKTVSTVEENVAKALTELQGTNELKALENLHFVAAKEIDVAGGKKAIIVFTPYRLHKKFQALQPRLGRELEKKFANTHFVFIAQRTILSTSVRLYACPESRAPTSSRPVPCAVPCGWQ
jgi:hypothetical protein